MFKNRPVIRLIGVSQRNDTAGPDLINQPPHYTFSSIEVIDAIEAWGLNYHLGNVVKYIARADHKENPIEDLKKARWYLAREVARRETR